MSHNNHHQSDFGHTTFPSAYTAKKIDVCTKPMKDNVSCPFCADKEICKKPILQLVRVLPREISQ